MKKKLLFVTIILILLANVTKLRLLYDKNIIKKVGEIVSSAFFAFQGQHK